MFLDLAASKRMEGEYSNQTYPGDSRELTEAIQVMCCAKSAVVT
jgi:hypothetical protein